MSFATHNRAVEITYEHVSGSTYDFTVRTIVRNCENCATRPELEINYGDGTLELIPCTDSIQLAPEVELNVYEGTHTYSEVGAFTIFIEDPNRNQDVLNISSGNINSVNIMMYTESFLVIQSLGEGISSPTFEELPFDTFCIDMANLYNSQAIDPDGDSLSYEIVACRQEDGEPIPSYVFPDDINPASDNQFAIYGDEGDVWWLNPKLQGFYNFVLEVNKWRNGELIGKVARDIQIFVTPEELCEIHEDPPPLSVTHNERSMLRLFPNPAQTTLNIEFPETTIHPGVVRAFTLTGQQVLSKQIQPTNMVELNVQNLAQGMYLIHVEIEGGERFVERVVLLGD